MPTHLSAQIENAIQKLTEGLVRICGEIDLRPWSFSALFVCYQLNISPFLVSDHICRIAQEAVRRFNEMGLDDFATYEIDEPDVEITLHIRSQV